MRRFTWALALMLLVFPASALADSLTFTLHNARLNIFANDGSGENVGFTLQGGGVFLQGTAGTPYDWFNVFSSYAPGSSFGGTSLFISSVDAGHVGGFGSDDISIDCCTATLFVSSFTFPTNGKSFTVSLPASISSITGTISSTGQQFTLLVPSGKLKISFAYDSSSGMYVPVGNALYTTAPEPASLFLMGTGLFATLGLVRRRRASSARTPSP